jgi:hypothetical protein
MASVAASPRMGGNKSLISAKRAGACSSHQLHSEVYARRCGRRAVPPHPRTHEVRSGVQGQTRIALGSGCRFAAPASPFVNRIMISALTDKGRVTLMNRDAKIRQANSASPVKLADRPALRAFLIEYFGFDLPEVEDLHVPTIPEWTAAARAAA